MHWRPEAYGAHRHVWEAVSGLWLVWSKGCEFNSVANRNLTSHSIFSLNNQNWRAFVVQAQWSETPKMGTGLEHFLRSHWFTANCFLIWRVLSALVKSQGTRFTETRAAVMNTTLTAQGMGSFKSGKGLFSCSLRNNPYPWAHINIALVCSLLSPKVTTDDPDVSRGGKVRMPEPRGWHLVLSVCLFQC